MKLYMYALSLSMFMSSSLFAGGDGQPTVTPTPSVKDECPPPAKKKKPDPCPKKPKPKPAPAKPKECPKCPTQKPCPEQKPCPTCEPRVVEKETVKYIDRTVTIDKAPKSTFNVFLGVGPHGIVTDSFATEDRKDEYAFRKEKDKSIGGVIGAQYQYRFSESWNANGLVLSNQTGLLGLGYSW
jgi:hypothetical protein